MKGTLKDLLENKEITYGEILYWNENQLKELAIKAGKTAISKYSNLLKYERFIEDLNIKVTTNITSNRIIKFIKTYCQNIVNANNIIEKQKKLLAKYAKEHGFTNTKFYVDDGYTGTNFNRPGFQQMLEDMEMGYISTVIVKDSSRFGRNYLEVGQYTDYYFPEHNIRFIAINDCIDSDNGEDDFSAFRNVMNEMYAKDISRKVRSSHRLRGNAGEPLAPPPYGYVKDSENKKKWIIDPDAAEVVQRIFRLCIEGNGNETIARILQDDKILVPQAYWQSKGMSRGGKKTQPNPYKWCKTTIAKMLEQQEYCGDIINFKSYSKSFRNKTRVENPKENWAIFKDVHEPIIDRETWERVQELTKNSKRRKPKNENVKKSIFTNLLYCGDCGHKLWFNINKQNPSIRFYSCSNYKGLRGTCESTHYVREDSLEQVVKMELFKLATYLDHDEDAFAELLEHKSNKDSMAERKAAESALAAATARSQELLRLYERVYEDNVNGKVTDDWFMRLSHKYEVEQEELKKQMFDLKNKIERLDTAQNSSGSFIRAIRKFMTMQTLTPIVLQELINKIEVFPIEGTGKNRTQRLVIHYRFVGCIDLPSIVPKHTYKLDSRQGVAIEYLPSAV